MTDTIKRLASASPRRTTLGTSLYDPGTGVKATVKHAIVTNTMPWDGYLWLSNGSMLTQTNRIIDGILVPAYKTIVVPLDYIVDGDTSDEIFARQAVPHTDIYGTASLLPTPAFPASGSGNSAASATVATGSWTSVVGTLYVAQVAWRDTTSIGTISSFSADATHGLTWVEVCTHTNPAGNLTIAHYVGVATAAAAGATTVNFSSNPDGAGIAIASVATDGTFDTTLAQGENAVACAGFAAEARAAVATPYIPFADRPILSNRILMMAGNGATMNGVTAASTGWTELTEVVTNESFETAYFLGTGTGVGGSYSAAVITTPGAGNAMSASCVEVLPGRLGHAEPLTVSLHGVEVTA